MFVLFTISPRVENNQDTARRFRKKSFIFHYLPVSTEALLKIGIDYVF